MCSSMELLTLFYSLVVVLLLLRPPSSFLISADEEGSILISTFGRFRYAFDIFTISLPTNTTPPQNILSLNNPNNELPITDTLNNLYSEIQITDGQSINYNGFFLDPSSDPSLFDAEVVYVSERSGSPNIYRDAFNFDSLGSCHKISDGGTVKHPLIPEENGTVSMKDRPSISGELLVYVSTHQESNSPRKSWAAVYSTDLRNGETKRLTPEGVADFSPAVSPSGKWTMVASAGEKGWDGKVEDMKTGLYVFKTGDGSERTKVVDHGGWPSWTDDSTVYFHRETEDGWWSVYRATFRDGSFSPVNITRITPPGLHALTPAAAKNGEFIVVATRRPTSEFRHIEVFDLVLNEFVEITSHISPNTHHYNPFVSSDSTKIGYHKSRGASYSNPPLLLENLKSPTPEVSLFRIDAMYPSFSPDGNQIAYVGWPGVYVLNRDGTKKREIFSDFAFSTAWDWKRKGVIYTSHGPTFSFKKKVHIVSISFNDDGTSTNETLTTGKSNNAFPSPSPDGRFLVFRSGRSGHRNLYIMDAVKGEKGGLSRLTEGNWTDTMCTWSPDGEWIAFSSNRDNPDPNSFDIYFIHPNGTGLRKVVQIGEGGKANHASFSPDSKSIVFTSDYAAVSAEPVSNPHHWQPYGEVFTASSSDGSGIRRLTHNFHEDGTPTWGPVHLAPSNVPDEIQSGHRFGFFTDFFWLSQNKKKPTHCYE